MKKLVTILLAVILVVGCVFTLTACGDKEPQTFYVLAGAQPGWDVVAKEDAPDKLDTTKCVVMEAAKADDARLASIADTLKGAKLIYVAEFTYDFVAPSATLDKDDTKAGWTAGPYALTEGGEALIYDGNATVKVIATSYKTEEVEGEEVSAWTKDWFSSPEHKAVSLTPATLYIPPYQENPAYTNSGSWNDNPVLLGAAGTYVIVFAQLADGSFGIGAIAK